MKKKKVFIPLDARIDLTDFRKLLLSFKDNEIKCVALTYDVADQLERANLTHEFRERAADRALLQKVNPFATELARHWFEKDSLNEMIHFDGVNLGSLATWELLYGINVLMDRWLNVRELVSEWQPEELINVYAQKNGRELRFQHDESALPSVCIMLAEEFKNLTLRNHIIKLAIEAPACKPRQLAAVAKQLFRDVVASTVISPLVAAYNLWLQATKTNRMKQPCVAFYSGWWHFLPALEELGNKENVRAVLIQQNFGIQILRKIVTTKVFPYKLQIAYHISESPLLWLQAQSIMEQVCVPNDFTFNNLNIWPLLKERFQIFWRYRTGYLIQCITEIKKCLTKIKPKLLVTENDSVPFEKAVTCVANKLGIQTLVLQHGATSGGEAGKRDYVDHAFVPLTASYLAVFGDISKNFFLNKGVSEERIFVTGCPRLDSHLKRQHYPNRSSFCDRLEIPKDKKVILYSNTPSNKNIYSTEYHLRFSEIEAILDALIHAVDRIPDAHLVIKMKSRAHQDRIDFADRHFGIYKRKNVTVIYETDNADLLHHSDVVVTSWSTMGFEGLLHQKPLITINLTGRPDPMPYAEMGAAIGIYQAEDVHSVLDRVLHDEGFRNHNCAQRDAFIRNYLVSHQGDGSHRFVDLVLKLTGSNQQNDRERKMFSSHPQDIAQPLAK